MGRKHSKDRLSVLLCALRIRGREIGETIGYRESSETSLLQKHRYAAIRDLAQYNQKSMDDWCIDGRVAASIERS